MFRTMASTTNSAIVISHNRPQVNNHLVKDNLILEDSHLTKIIKIALTSITILKIKKRKKKLMNHNIVVIRKSQKTMNKIFNRILIITAKITIAIVQIKGTATISSTSHKINHKIVVIIKIKTSSINKLTIMLVSIYQIFNLLILWYL